MRKSTNKTSLSQKYNNFLKKDFNIAKNWKYYFAAPVVIILIAIMLKYYLAPFLFVADEDMDVMEAIHKSTVLTRATAVDFLILVLSFLGWILLSVLVMPLIFTLPYMVMSYVVHSRFAVANYNKVVKEFKKEGTDNAFSADSFKI